MSPYARPLRSLLFVPGNRADWIGKAVASGADAVIIDLSDAVPASEIDSARRNVTDFLAGYPAAESDAAILVRPNEVHSPLFCDDVAAAVRAGLYGLMLPLINDPADVGAAVDVVAKAEEDNGVPHGRTVIVPSLETAASLRQAFEIARVSDRIEHMGAGASEHGDIAHSLRYRWSAEGTETITYRAMVLVDVRAAGIAYPVSGLWGRIADTGGLRRYATQTRNLGYTGMMVIHPSHVDIVNEVFSPTAHEMADWKETIDAMRAAQASGVGATRWRGKLIDEADVRTALDGLEYARRLGLEP